MEHGLKKEGRYTYFEAGEGTPIIVLHGLMGGLSNFESAGAYFSQKGYKIIIPELPIYTQSLLRTNDAIPSLTFASLCSKPTGFRFWDMLTCSLQPVTPPLSYKATLHLWVLRLPWNRLVM
jgi:hypothetical protein